MKNIKYLSSILSMVFVVACFQTSALGQDDKDFAVISGSGSSVKWDVAAPYSVLTMTISAPDGRLFRKQFKGGTSPQFTLVDDKGERLPDGQYSYELRLTPVFAAGVKEELASARAKESSSADGRETSQGLHKDDSVETVREMRKRGLLPAELVKSGGFSILNGGVVVAGAAEDSDPKPVSKISQQPRLTGATSAALMKLRRHHLSPAAMPDQVIPDDLIVQGSLCVGLDCVNNENFGFDTIRLKENNTRIQFDDTSVGAFPTNNWQIRANSSASGGQSFLGFVDQGASGNSQTGTIVFEVDAGAPANSLRVSNLGRIGLRTGTPVLDIHVNTSNTPAIRLEQNNSGGFTAQTWDIGANEANFFVRDVTNGSLLPFRVRPGAPTSSLDVSADGDVGIGTASPGKSVDVVRSGADAAANQAALRARTTGATGFGPAFYLDNSSMTSGRIWSIFASGSSDGVGATGVFNIFDGTAGAARMTIDTTGRVGIATTAPTETLSVNGTASKPGGGTWAVFSDERLKNIKGNFNSGLKAVMALQPLRYEYKRNNALDINSPGEHIGFGAQAVQKVLPEAVSRTENGYLQVNSDPILWSMLNAIKEQQKEIEQLKGEIRQLRAASRRRR